MGLGIGFPCEAFSRASFTYFSRPFRSSSSFSTENDAIEEESKAADLPGIAKSLMRAALEEVAKKREMRYSDLRKIDIGVRRHFHDDITVVVIYLDHDLLNAKSNLLLKSKRSFECTSCLGYIFFS